MVVDGDLTDICFSCTHEPRSLACLFGSLNVISGELRTSLLTEIITVASVPASVTFLVQNINIYGTSEMQTRKTLGDFLVAYTFHIEAILFNNVKSFKPPDSMTTKAPRRRPVTACYFRIKGKHNNSNKSDIVTTFCRKKLYGPWFIQGIKGQ